MGAMPQDPFIREKFTRERTAAKKLAAEYFERFPLPDRGRELAPPAISEYRNHHEAPARADRRRWLIGAGNDALMNRYRCRAVASCHARGLRQIHHETSEG